MKTAVKINYESPIFYAMTFQVSSVMIASYNPGGAGQYGEEDIIDNGEY